jgi:capsular polysaccharide biosynthesis protein
MISKTKEILYSKEQVERTPPANLKANDKFLFANSSPATLKEVHLYYYKNVNVTPEGIVFKGLKIDPDLLIYAKHKKMYNALYLLSSIFRRKKIKLAKQETYLLIFDYWSNSIFHWMCDALPRLEAMKEKAKDCILLIPENYEYTYIHASLKAYKTKGVYRMPLNSYVKCKTLLAPDQITVSGEIRPQNLRSVRNTLLEYYQPLFKHAFTQSNIYISRNKAKYRKVINEEELIPLLIEYNFSIVYFEDLDFTEQVECCYHARNIISIHGANLTNIVFMKAKGNVLEFRKNNDPDNNYFYEIADSVGCNYYYQNCETIDNVPGYNFFDLKVDKTALEENIKLMLKIS